MQTKQELIVSLLVNNYDKITGISSYTFSLLRALESAGDGPLKLLTTWTPRGVADMGLTRTEVVHLTAGQSGMLTPIGYTLHANRHLTAGSGAVLVSTNPMGNFVSPVPQITVFHDLYRRIPGLYPLHQRWFFEAYARAVVHSSRAVVAVSHVTADDVVSWMPSVRNRLHVVGEGSQFAPEAGYDPNGTSLLFVANVEINKNVSCLLEALRLLEVAGEQIEVRWIGRDRSGEVERWLAVNGPLRSLKPLGVVDRETLAAEYRRAGGLVVTSTAEGFCLPVVEAHGFSVPAILSDIPILREVGGDAGIFFDPFDAASLAGAIRRFRADRALRTRLSTAAAANFNRHGWDKAAVAMLRLADQIR